MTSTEGGRGRSAEVNFARHLRVLRDALGVSQAELASRLTVAGTAVPQQTVARIEAGKRAIRLDEAKTIAEILRVPLEDMMRDPLEGLAPDEMSIELGDTVDELIHLDEEFAISYRRLEECRKNLREVETYRESLFRQKARAEVRLEALSAIGALGPAAGRKVPVGTQIAAARIAANYLPIVLTLRAGLPSEAESIVRAFEQNDFSVVAPGDVHSYIRKLAMALDLNGDDLVTQYEMEQPEDD